MKKLVTSHNLGRIKIRQYEDTNFEYGDPLGTYYTASINGWRGFKFVTKDLKIQELLEITYECCKKILDDLDINGDKCLSSYPDTIELNSYNE